MTKSFIVCNFISSSSLCVDTLGDMFHCLHDDDPEVISEDVFYQWEKSQQEEGNGVALLQTQNFFEWMKSAEEEDEEGGN